MCKNIVFTTDGNRVCGDQDEDGTQYFCYPCLEGMINGAHSAVQDMALALHFVREEHERDGCLCADTLDGISETLEGLGFIAPTKRDRPVYPH